MLSGELGVSQAFLARWYIGGSYMDIVVSIINRIQDSCVVTYPIPSLIAYNTGGMMHLKKMPLKDINLELSEFQLYIWEVSCSILFDKAYYSKLQLCFPITPVRPI